MNKHTTKEKKENIINQNILSKWNCSKKLFLFKLTNIFFCFSARYEISVTNKKYWKINKITWFESLDVFYIICLLFDPLGIG